MRAFGKSIVVSLCLGCFFLVAAEKSAEKATVKVEFRRAEKAPAEGLTEAVVAGSKDKVYLHKTAEITNADIDSARATEDAAGKPVVEVTLTEEGARKMRRLTEEHKDKPLAILVDSKVIAAPTVRSTISEKALMISGLSTKDEAEKLAKGIKAK